MHFDKTPRIILGFDFGMKRIGVAVGQTLTRTASPLETLKANAGSPNWQDIERIINKWQPDAIVIGMPLNMDGTTQAITSRAKLFAENLGKRFDLPIYEVDERLTTKDAKEKLFKRGGFRALQDGQVDSVAAQLILQNWFAENLTQ